MQSDDGTQVSGELHYIGEDDCRKATCTLPQEFPDGGNPYCILHGLAEWINNGGARP